MSKEKFKVAKGPDGCLYLKDCDGIRAEFINVFKDLDYKMGYVEVSFTLPEPEINEFYQNHYGVEGMGKVRGSIKECHKHAERGRMAVIKTTITDKKHISVEVVWSETRK